MGQMPLVVASITRLKPRRAVRGGSRTQSLVSSSSQQADVDHPHQLQELCILIVSTGEGV